MAPSRNRNRRTFADHFEATFGRRVDARKMRGRALLALGLGAALVTGGASADWYVKDRDAIEVLKDIRKGIGTEESVNKKLKELNDKMTLADTDLKIGDGSAENPELVKPQSADENLASDKDKPTPATVLNVDESGRCPAPTPATPIATQQQTVCKELYKTEIAKYRFSVEMYKIAEKRHEKLQELINERNGYGAAEFAKMEENTNKLLALQVQMDNDRDRYTTYMQAYDARMVNLQKSKELLAERVVNGKPNALGIGAGAAFLIGALAVTGSGPDGNPIPQNN